MSRRSRAEYPQASWIDRGFSRASRRRKGILCHVDACFGGFMLPWLEKLGAPVRRSLPATGRSSMS